MTDNRMEEVRKDLALAFEKISEEIEQLKPQIDKVEASKENIKTLQSKVDSIEFRLNEALSYSKQANHRLQLLENFIFLDEEGLKQMYENFKNRSDYDDKKN